MTIRIGARRSPLARAQAEDVAAALEAAGHQVEMVGITTEGDTDRRHLTEIGGTGVFATAVRDRLRDNTIDVAVHSLKDLPTAEAPGLEVAAMPPRAPVHDLLVGVTSLAPADLNGLRIGTGSPRRAAQLRNYALEHDLDLEIVPIRGNVDTRLDLVVNGEVDAVVLAAAGVHRLGYLSEGVGGEGAVSTGSNGVPATGSTGASSAGSTVVRGLPATAIPLNVMLPAAGQGALGIEIRADDDATRAAVEALDDRATRASAVAERSFLATLEAGCLAPVGVAARLETEHDTSHDLTMAAVIALDGDDGESLVTVTGVGSSEAASEVGADLAREALAAMASVGQLHTPETDGLR